MTERGEHLVQAGRVPTIGGRTGKHQCQITQNLGQLIEFGNAPHADHGCDGLAAARHHDVAALGISHQPGDASLGGLADGDLVTGVDCHRKNEQLLSGQQRRGDQALAGFAPEVLDQFSAVFRRLQEAASAQPDTAAEEELAQAVTACRRILKAIVDTVQPADPTRPLSADGHSLTDEGYKNRLFEFLKTLSNSARYSTALMFAGKGLIDRFDAMDALASKGVHASVARHEAEFCAMNTYLLAGEILQLHPVGAASSPP